METAADLLIRIRRGQLPRPAALPSAAAPADEAEAYAIQQAVMTRLGASTGGWKASMPDDRSGTSAPVAHDNLLFAGAPLRNARFRTAATPRIGIEPEVSFMMARALPPLPAGRSYSRAEVLSAVASAHAAIELCVCRFTDFAAAPALDRLADAIMNEGLAVGSACHDWSSLKLSELPLRVLVDEEVVHSGLGGHPLVDPVIPLVWMANHLSLRQIGLRVGDVITTGSCNGIRHIDAGKTVTADFGPLGSVTVTL
jgi:2-keto-4-pentenoate hydratase